MKKIYFPNLNGLRFFAALSVMIYHFFGIDALNGHYGVVLFFVLSGFLITYLLLAEKEKTKTISIRKFYARRILRIWPLYFFILFISSLSTYLSVGLHADYFVALPYFLFFLPNLAFVLEMHLNYAGILWSIGAEEQFYFVWPWIVKKIGVNKLIYLFMLIVLFWTFGSHVIDFINYNFLSNNPSIQTLSKFIGRMGFGAMATGATLAFVARFHSDKLRYIYSLPVQLLALTAVLFIWIFDVFPQTAITDQVYAILFAILIANFALNPKVLFSLENKLFNYLGKISFGLYVYHLIAFDLTRYFFDQLSVNPIQILKFSVGLILTVLISSLSYNLLEKPFLRLKAKKFTVVKSGNDIGKKELK